MEEVLDQARAKVAGLVKRQDKFLEVQPEVFEAAKVVAKVVYDCARANEEARATDSLPELVIEEFDEEQVWAGVDLHNRSVVSDLRAKVAALVERSDSADLLVGSVRRKKSSPREVTEEEGGSGAAKKRRIRFEEEDDELDEGGTDEGGSEEEVDGEEEEEEEEADELDPDFQHMSDSDGDDLPLFENARSDDEDDETDEEEKEEKRKEIDEKADSYMDDVMKSLRKNTQRSEVDDDFFKLSEMEKFLEKEDAAEQRRQLREEKGLLDEEDEEGGGDDDIDYFDMGGDSGDEADERAKYKEYFEGDTDRAGADRKGPANEKAVAKGKTSADLFEEEEDESEKNLGEVKSTYEEGQIRLRKKIRMVEDEAVKEKPWQMTGEVAGPARPENSLLQEHLDYDNVAKQAPVITEEVSKRLEDIILQRVKDKAWDDVERKVKPKEDPYEYKKRLVLDQEKSKLSLAQIYEQEYLEQQSKTQEQSKVQGLLDEKPDEVPKEVEEIKKSMKSLFAKLDILTHFHYTPKNLDPEIKIIRNMPSIAMEEVAPVSRSDASLLAPKEMQEAPRGELVGRGERSDTDKKRERRKKKARQGAVRKEKERRKSLGSAKGKTKKEVLAKEIEEAEKKGKLKRMSDGGKDKGVKSSMAFFTQLQQEVTEGVKEKRGKSRTFGIGGKKNSGATFKL